MFVFIVDKSIDTMMAGLEAIAGNKDQHYWYKKMDRFNDNCLMPLLVKNSAGAEYTAVYEEGECQLSLSR